MNKKLISFAKRSKTSLQITVTGSDSALESQASRDLGGGPLAQIADLGESVRCQAESRARDAHRADDRAFAATNRRPDRVQSRLQFLHGRGVPFVPNLLAMVFQPRRVHDGALGIALQRSFQDAV